MKNIKLFASIFLVSLIALVGCGGGSGDSVPTFEKDVAGITTTLEKFAAALRSGDVASTGLFAQTSAEQTTKILFVHDFGVDINNPADNQQWEFSVLPANINQTAPNAAIVRASKVMSTGKTLWLIFAMVRDQGVWLIEGISTEETGTAGAFVTKRYFPITVDSSMKYLESGTPPSFYIEGFSATDKIEKNGMFFYRQTFNYESPLAGSFRAQRALMFENVGFYLGYNATGELWAYSEEVNNGQPYRVMKATYAFGEKEIITETYPFGTFVTTMTIGTQKEFKTTPLRTFETIPVLEEVKSSLETAQATETSRMYFADGVGVVMIEDFGTDLTRPESTDQLFERYVQGVYDRNLPDISPKNTSQNVISGKPMNSVFFNATGGTTPITWSLENVPAGISINPKTGEMAGTPPSELTTHYINVVATDVYGRRGFQQFDLAVVKAPPFTITSDNAMLSAGGTYKVIIGQPVQTTSFAGFSTVGGAAVKVVEWSITGTLPSGITFNTSTGALSGRDASTAPANYPITIHGVDDQGGIGDFSFTLAVEKAPALTLSTSDAITSQTVVAGSQIKQVTFSATGSLGGTINWSISGNPSGISINSDGLLSGAIDVMATAQVFSITVTANDTLGGTGSIDYAITVQPRGTYYIPAYYPTVSGDKYEYAQLTLPDLKPTPDRTMVEILPDKVSLAIAGGEIVDFYKDVTTDLSAPAVSIRAAVRPPVRSGLRGALPAQPTTPQDIYYRGQDSQGNIWQYNEIINSAVPYLIFPAWMNPGDQFEFTQNINDEIHPAQSAVTRIFIGSSLVNGVGTPLGVYDNVLKITFYTSLTPSDQPVQEFASQLYCAKNLGVVAYSSYTDQTLAVCDYQELILSTVLAGVRTENPVSITSPSVLPYSTSVSLNATGGELSKGYTWSLVGGALPVDFTLNPSGTLTGPSVSSPGSFEFMLQATDYYFRTATKTFTMTVP